MASNSKRKIQFADNRAGRVAKNLAKPLQNFLALESSGGILLLFATALALFFANSQWSDAYFHIIHFPIQFSIGPIHTESTMLHFVNDGLMVLFFYVVGLEIKRELLFGRLSDPKKASFTIFAAIGGMLVPALIFALINKGSISEAGWGIPMATDIAFAVGVMALVGSRVPIGLKVFLLAFAIVDDLGAVAVIAFFYTKELQTQYLGFAAGILFFLYMLSSAGIRHLMIGITLGLLTWYCFLKSGVHATIAGVILAFLTPSGEIISSNKKPKKNQDSSVLVRWESILHPWVSYLIMPIFAFFNAGVLLKGTTIGDLIDHPVSLGILCGLILGKPVGILLASILTVKLKIATLPTGVNWWHILSAGILGGVGFTMSLFIDNLAFQGNDLDTYSKTAILMASTISGVMGYIALSLTTSQKKTSR